MLGIGSIDEPNDLEKVGRFLRSKGWTIVPTSEKPILCIDDIPLGEVQPFIYRDDVKNDNPEAKIVAPTGFDQFFELPDLQTGLHTLSLKSTGGKSIQAKSARLINLLPQTMKLSLLKSVEKTRFHWIGNEPTMVMSTRNIDYNPKFDQIIKTVGIETSRICNFQCHMCPAHSQNNKFKQGTSVADEKLLDRITPFLQKYNYSIRRIDTGSVWGEPLMNKKFFEYTEKVMRSCPKSFADLTTNGSFLTTSNIKKLLSMKYLRQITVSIDAGTKKTYEKIRKGGNWEILIQNLSNLIQEKRKRNLKSPLISTNYVLLKSNFKELPQYVETMARLGVNTISAVNAHNCYKSDLEQGIFDLPGKISDIAEEREEILGRLKTIDLPKETRLNIPSFTPKRKSAECSLDGASTMVVGIEGNVYPCCVIQELDHEGKLEAKPMGNVFDEELESLWNNLQFTDFRIRMFRGHIPNNICLSCPSFYGM